tara:strand:+ start:140 stop:355 length:216 start_codon:yes stop_codon:yes gene_type:complete
VKYKVGQLVRVKDDVVSDGHGDFLHTGVYFIGLIVGLRIAGLQGMGMYDILCVGDRESEVFFESEIMEVLQ